MKVHPQNREAYNLFHDGILSLARAERQGIRVDTDYVESALKRINKKKKNIIIEFKDTKFFHDWDKSVRGTVNINSPVQLATFLYKVKGLTPKKKTKTDKGSTDEEALSQLNIPAINKLLESKKFKKTEDVLKGFLREQVDGYIHPFFNLHIARSYRSSSDNPNLQNIPIRDEVAMKYTRSALYPRPGHQLFEIDFKGIEVAINACYNKDTNLINYVSDLSSDMHGDMAKQIFLINKFDKSKPDHDKLRKATKNGFVFPEFYGDYYGNCAEHLACTWGELTKTRWKPGQGISVENKNLSDLFIKNGITSFKKFTNHIKEIEQIFWEERFPEYAKWKVNWYKQYQRKGYFDLLTGFRCSGVMDSKAVCNYPGQGTAFHCLLWSLNKSDHLMRTERWDTKIISQIHDSILLDVHPDELQRIARKIKKITTVDLPEAWKWINVPLEVDAELCEVDRPWSTKQPYKLPVL